MPHAQARLTRVEALQDFEFKVESFLNQADRHLTFLFAGSGLLNGA